MDFFKEDDVRLALSQSRPQRVVLMFPTEHGSRHKELVDIFLRAVKPFKNEIQQLVWVSHGDIDQYYEQNLGCYSGLMESYRRLYVSQGVVMLCCLKGTLGLWLEQYTAIGTGFFLPKPGKSLRTPELHPVRVCVVLDWF